MHHHISPIHFLPNRYTRSSRTPPAEQKHTPDLSPTTHLPDNYDVLRETASVAGGVVLRTTGTLPESMGCAVSLYLSEYCPALPVGTA